MDLIWSWVMWWIITLLMRMHRMLFEYVSGLLKLSQRWL
jgi:hypothetical protein